MFVTLAIVLAVLLPSNSTTGDQQMTADECRYALYHIEEWRGMRTGKDFEDLKLHESELLKRCEASLDRLALVKGELSDGGIVRLGRNLKSSATFQAGISGAFTQCVDDDKKTKEAIGLAGALGATLFGFVALIKWIRKRFAKIIK